MKIQQFLEHHGIAENPFAEEDAQTDHVFKDHCITSTFHPTWDKVFGNPAEPATAVVFGEKGSGKTAMRLQIARHLEAFNRSQPERRAFVIHYDDLNPFLDRFCDRLGSRQRRRPDRALAQWKLWDHMDAILALGVTQLVDGILAPKDDDTPDVAAVHREDFEQLLRHEARDLLLLAACYDQSTAETFYGRWQQLRKRLRFGTLAARWPFLLGCAWSAIGLLAVAALFAHGHGDLLRPLWLYLLLIIGGWIPWVWQLWNRHWLARSILRHQRVGNRDTSSLRRALQHILPSELSGQPLPNKDRTDDRYELLLKFQALLRRLKFSGVLVLVDRLDEPHLINGSAELMKAVLWPLLDNKFLKHPGLGLKLMLPMELTRYIEREERPFYERARLDKQNLIPSFAWSGEALFDVASSRLQACALEGHQPALRELFDASLSEQRLIETFRTLRVPRHLFKFLYRLLVAHCNAHTTQEPNWHISRELFDSTLAVHLRDQEAFDRGLGAG
jgi:hypothetical protein